MKKQLVLIGTLLAASASFAAVASAPMVHPDRGQGQVIPLTVIEDGVRKDVTTDDEFYDFNGTQQGWVSHGTGREDDTWHVEAVGPGSGGANVWWSGNVAEGGYLSSHFAYLQTPAINFSGATAGATLTFQLYYSGELPGGEPAGYNSWDGCNVWASTDGGNTWAVITGTPAYTSSSSFAFGDEFGMGTGIPAWAGTNGSFQAASFNLGAFAGQSDLRLRWVFCADPAFDVLDDPDMTGMEIDNIVVNNGSGSVWSDNGTSNTGGAPVHGYEVYGNDWVYTGSDWVCDDNPSLGGWIESPNITGIVPPARISLVQDIWCDMPDQDGNDDGFLEDYFHIEYSTDNGATWTTACYDYARLDWATGYYTYSNDDVFNGSLVITLATQTQFMLRYRITTDDNSDGGDGTGLHIDNATVTIASVPLHDLGVTKAWYNYPRVVGETQLPKLEITNFGATTETPVRANYIVYQDSIGGPIVHTNTFAHLTATSVPGLSSVRVEMATTDPAVFKWTPLTAGLYTAKFFPNPAIAGWATLDEDHSNDTLVVDLGITDQNVGFLRYDYDISSAWTLGQNAGEDGALVRFDPFRLDNETNAAPTHPWDPEFLNLTVYNVVPGDIVTIVIHDEGDSSSAVGPLLASYNTTIIDASDVYPNTLNRWIGNFPELKCRNTPVWIGVRSNSNNATGVVGLSEENGAPYWTRHTYGHDYLSGTTSEWNGDLRFFVQMSWGVEAEIPFTINLDSQLIYTPNKTIALSWNSPGAVDGYAIHASTDPFFTPNGGTLVTTVDQYTTTYQGDASVLGTKLFYKVIGFNGLCQ